jgi:hypothetical protein
VEDAGVAILDWAGIGRTESRNGSTSACDGGGECHFVSDVSSLK